MSEQMKVVKTYQMIELSELKFGATYQRCIEPAREKRIAKSIREHGYWPQEVIIVNQNKEIIDGQHRVQAAKEVGVERVPISIVSFDTLKTEASFFAQKNNWNTNLKPVDFWYARLLAEDPYAKLMYQLNRDKDCLLYKRISVKGQKYDEVRFPISSAAFMINMALGKPYRWRKNLDYALVHSVKRTSYIHVFNYINDFLTFFFKSFSEDKKSNPIPYQTKCFVAIGTFYVLATDNTVKGTSISKLISKMSKYVFTSDFVKADHIGRIQALVNFYNKGRTKNRIKYEA